MKKLLFFLIVSLIIPVGTPLAGTGETGSKMDGKKVQVTKMELQKDDGTYVTVYTGSQYLETVGSGAGTFAGILEGTKPAEGTYKGLRLTVSGFKIKAKIVDGGTTWYTTAETLEAGNVWNLSTTEADYDYLTRIAVGSTPVLYDFPTPLVVQANSDVNLIWALQYNGIVIYEGLSIDSITWASEEDIVGAVLPDMPAKVVQFNLVATKEFNPDLSNSITMFYNSGGELIGGYCHRPDNKAINGSQLKDGSVTDVLDGGNAATFDITFRDGTGVGHYQLTGSYDCDAGTYSDLAVTASDVVSNYETLAYTLTVTGSVTCTDI